MDGWVIAGSLGVVCSEWGEKQAVSGCSLDYLLKECWGGGVSTSYFVSYM